jgi:hypothetical protein
MCSPFGARAVALVSALGIALLTAGADAQTCHAPSLLAPSELGFRVSVTQLFAVFDEAGMRGDYQGLIATLAFHHPRVSVELGLPAYRIEQMGSGEIGPGDVTADVRVTWLRSESGSVATGIELATSLPTGDETRDLGMGHVMLMPGVWLRASHESFSLLAQLAYGHALGDGAAAHSTAHAHGGGTPVAMAMPRVNPMNASELEHALGLSYSLHPNLSVTGRWLGAIPLEDEGTARQILAPGLQLVAGALDSALEAQVPVAGDPFEIKLLVSVGATL